MTAWSWILLCLVGIGWLYTGSVWLALLGCALLILQLIAWCQYS
jgi:hypothetical protein